VAVCVGGDTQALATLCSEHPRLLVIPYQDGWTHAVIMVATESLRRIEASRRAERAERIAADSAGYATLGRYMLEMRHSVNNALTSVLGNADLLLLEPGQLSGLAREQIKTIHSMSLRLNEIFQRFSSLATEMREVEKESQAETENDSQALTRRS
jgi:signal transduction histidine kinase